MYVLRMHRSPNGIFRPTKQKVDSILSPALIQPSLVTTLYTLPKGPQS